MNWLDATFWWVGAAVCATGALFAIVCLMWAAIDLAWRRYCDMTAFVEVVREAQRQGRSILK